MAVEKEYLAMRAIDRAFSSLKTAEDKERVVKWTVDKYSPTPKPITVAVNTGYAPQPIHQQPIHQQPMQTHGIQH